MQNHEVAEYVRSLESRLVDMECAVRRMDAALRHIGESYGIASGCSNRGKYFGRGK